MAAVSTSAPRVQFLAPLQLTPSPAAPAEPLLPFQTASFEDVATRHTPLSPGIPQSMMYKLPAASSPNDETSNILPSPPALGSHLLVAFMTDARGSTASGSSVQMFWLTKSVKK